MPKFQGFSSEEIDVEPDGNEFNCPKCGRLHFFEPGDPEKFRCMGCQVTINVRYRRSPEDTS